MKLVILASLCALLCACASKTVEPLNEDDFASAPISFRGTTQLRMNRVLVSIPASAMPSGITGCRVEAEEKGRSGDYGLELDEPVWDVNIYCDREEIRELFDAITVCIVPEDGAVAGKAVYQQHSGSFSALPSADGLSGYTCGLAEGLSLFTLGFED